MNLLREIRVAQGHTQESLGHLAGLTSRQISHLELGHCRPRRKTLLALARALKVDPRLLAEPRDANAPAAGGGDSQEATVRGRQPPK